MVKKIAFLVNILQKKGIIETALYAAKILWDSIFSIIKIYILKLRGYRIEYSVKLRGENFFFQSTKKSITIAKGTVVGKHTRISAGGTGKVAIGENVLIDDFTFIMAHEKILIGKNTKIAAFCFITDFNHNFHNKIKSIREQGYKTKPVIIGRNVWIGTHAIILPGVVIGDGSVVGAGSVVAKSIPSRSVAVGNPAKVIRRI